MRKLLFLVIGFNLFIACGNQSTQNEPAPGEFLHSKIELFSVDSINYTSLLASSDSLTQAAFDLQNLLSSGQGNLFFSPFSIWSALGMLNAGARGNTASQILSALHEPSYLNESISYAMQQNPWVTIDNNLWIANEFSVEPTYLDVLGKYYKNGLYRVDFSKNSAKVLDAINQWMQKKTNHRIQNLLPPNSIDATTRLVLTSSIYFNGKWSVPFDPIEDMPFYKLDGTMMNVPMMGNHYSMGYYKGDIFQAVFLDYKSPTSLSMFLFVPDRGKFEEFQEKFNSGLLNQISMGSREVIFKMPKFEHRNSFDIVKTLKKMGVIDAFSQNADFSGITNLENIQLSAALHQAYIKVDEKGTEAAAATAIAGESGASPHLDPPPTPIRLTIDRPFYFIIKDWKSGMILFMGRVVSPV